MIKLPSEIQNRVKNELKHDEVVIWSGQPNPEKFMKSGFAAWVFFIPWTAFSVFWLAGVSGFRIPDFSNVATIVFTLFGLPFLLIGIHGLNSPVRLKSEAKNTAYIITNQRAFSLEGKKTVRCKSYYPKQLDHIETKQNPDGSGDIIMMNVSNGESTVGIGFLKIDNVKIVENLLSKLAQGKGLGSNLSQ